MCRQIWHGNQLRKSKVMVNSNDSSLHAEITLNDNTLEVVNAFCYLGETLSNDDSCETDIRIRLALATSAMIRIYVIGNSRHIQFKLNYNVYRSLVLFILTYGCEAWTISIAIKNKLQVFETQKTAGHNISGKKDECVCKREDDSTNRQILSSDTHDQTTQIKWYEHISRYDGFSKTIMKYIVEGSQKQGRPKSQSFNNISDWTKMDANQLLHTVHDGRRKCIVKAEITELIPSTISSHGTKSKSK